METVIIGTFLLLSYISAYKAFKFRRGELNLLFLVPLFVQLSVKKKRGSILSAFWSLIPMKTSVVSTEVSYLH
jgi:hypothetical protein